MTIPELVLIIAGAVYFALYLIMSFFFPERNNKSHIPDKSVTVIVAFRNEADRLPALLKSLKKQSVKPERIILVNDHSEDESRQIAQDFSIANPGLNMDVFDLSENGKRAAIRFACSKAETDWVLCIDADCEMAADWVKTMISQRSENCKILGAPVLYKKQKKVLNSIFRAELLFLVSTGIAAAKMKLPFQLSGAGLLFRRNDYLDFAMNPLGRNYNHGDDVFFIQYIIRKFGLKSVCMASEPDTVVRTVAPESVSKFINQRLRWVSKAPSYKSSLPFLFSSLVFAGNLVFVVAIIMFYSEGNHLFLGIAASKVLVEFIFCAFAAFTMKYAFSFAGQLLLSVIYPLYLLLILMALPFSGRKTWKGRTV